MKRKKKNNKIRNSVTNLKKIFIFQSFSSSPRECSERIHLPHVHINNDVKLTLYLKEINVEAGGSFFPTKA